MARGSCLILLALVLSGGCVSQPEQEAPFPLKIGLLADSQITSQNGFSDFHYRSKTADSLVDVAIRPPVLECVLAEEMLRIALKRLSEDSDGDREGVDVILYLGDGANSGGEDEIDAVLHALEDHRAKTGTPIFIVIGNHDYLGTGNIVTPGIRFALLNREGQPQVRALTKYDVLKKFSAFNHGNIELASSSRFRYVDNIATVEQNRHLDHDTGLYLGGVLTYAEEDAAEVEIFLLDSSDYKDSPDWSKVADLGFYGAIGSVSFEDQPELVSQLSYFRAFADASTPDYRLLASHYPKDHLDRITFAKPDQVPLDLTNVIWDVTEAVVSVPTFTDNLNRHLNELHEPGKRNYWMSAHTHVHAMPRPRRFIVGGWLGEKYFSAVNVGSTTDYQAHVAIVERFDKQRNTRLDDAVGFREIPLAWCDDALLESVSRAIGDFGREYAGDPVFQYLIDPMDEWIGRARTADRLNLIRALSGRRNEGLTYEDRYWIDVGTALLGLNKEYRDARWGDHQTEAAVKNLDQFITAFVGETHSDRDEVIACLGMVAGAYECGRLSAKSDFSLRSLQRLRDDPT